MIKAILPREKKRDQLKEIEYGGGHANPILKTQVKCLVTSGNFQSCDGNITTCRGLLALYSG